MRHSQISALAFFLYSLPFLFLIACVLQLAMNRSRGGVKNRFIRKEIDACKKVRFVVTGNPNPRNSRSHTHFVM
jgi:hypothetical protein